MSPINRVLRGALALICAMVSYSHAAQPTHYLYVPRSYALKTKHFVMSTHELAVGIDSRLHLAVSPLTAIDDFRTRGYYGISDMFLSAKYARNGNWSACLGVAAGPHWLNNDYGLGGYFSKRVSGGSLQTDFAVNAQMNQQQFVTGFGLGAMALLGDHARLLFEGEVDIGAITDYSEFGFNVNGGVALRYALPPLPALRIDLGFGANKVVDPSADVVVRPYIDLSYSHSM